MRFGSKLWAVPWLVACAPTETARVPSPPRVSNKVEQAGAFDAARSASQYRRAPSVNRRNWVDDTEKDLQLLSGRRVQQRNGGYELADTVATPALVGFVRAPGFAGGGFVFWSHQALYRSRTFLGRLEPLAATPFAIQRLAFGPGYVLAISNDGQRRVFDATSGAARAPSPTGLVDVAAAADGRVVAVLELGRAVLSVDQGAHFREVTPELAGTVTSLSQDPLGFVVDTNTLFRVAGGGQLVASALAKPKPSKDPRWPLSDTPLERAVADGVPRGAGHALVAASAALAEVDLQSGELLSVGPQLLPGSPECQLLEQGVELLMRCQSQGSLSIVAQVDSAHPVVERTFKGRPSVSQGFGQLLVESGCDDGAPALAVCIRTAGGSWKSLAIAPEPGAALDSNKPQAATSVPPAASGYALKADGGAVAFVDGEPSGGYLDLKTRKLVALGSDFTRVVAAQSSCLVEAGGTLRCLTRNGPLSFSADGKLEHSPYGFSWAASSGARALGLDAQRHLFQSDDSGQTWREVAGPPLLDQNADSGSRCSAVGCKVGPWLRLGWEPRAAAPLPEPEPIAPLPLVTPPTAVLACTSQQSPTTALSPALASEGSEHAQRSSGFGSESIAVAYFRMGIEAAGPSQASLGSMALRGVITGVLDENADPAMYARSGKPLGFRFVDYFDTKAKKAGASLPLGELFRAARDAGNPTPTLDFPDQVTLQALPVLGREPGKTAGFLLARDSNQIWLNGTRASSFAFDITDGTLSASSAALDRDGTLLLLLDNDSGPGRVARLTRGAVSQLFERPSELLTTTSTPDALGLADNGDIAVLRFSSGSSAPSREYPVLAFRPGKPIEALAPWSSLLPASDPACNAGGGYRALVLPNESWLQLSRAVAGTPDDEDAGMTALVRWSKERVCLEAVELGDATFSIAEQELATRVSASFLAKPEAARLGFGLGFELRQPLSCELRAVAR